jgi:hypothetical protein
VPVDGDLDVGQRLRLPLHGEVCEERQVGAAVEPAAVRRDVAELFVELRSDCVPVTPDDRATAPLGVSEHCVHAASFHGSFAAPDMAAAARIRPPSAGDASEASERKERARGRKGSASR